MPDEIPKMEDKKREIFELLCKNPEAYNVEMSKDKEIEVKEFDRTADWNRSIGISGE